MTRNPSAKMGEESALFADRTALGGATKPLEPAAPPRPRGGPPEDTPLVPAISPRLLEVYERAQNPEDAFELCGLYLGRVEAELGHLSQRPQLAARWRESRRLRAADPAGVLNSKATARFVKELFNWFFRDDLYGALRSEKNIILSTGSVNETVYGLPPVLKECINYALNRDWYGYSDSRGREATREAICAYENARVEGGPYARENVAVTLGGTSAVGAVVDFLALTRARGDAPALCATPSYPPLIESVARRFPVSLVPLPCGGGETSLRPLISALEPATPLVLVQTATNPTGTRVPEAELEELINAVSPGTVVVLDECHECLGPVAKLGRARAHPNVVRVASLSKSFSAPGLKLGWITADDRFIQEYYEYASTSYGSPPSVFYLLLEVMARLECWRLEGLGAVGAGHLSAFEAEYGLTLESLQAAYEGYVEHRRAWERALVERRAETVERVGRAGLKVVCPDYSLNVLVSPPDCEDDYRYFRELLAATGVSLYPGILSFCLDGNWLRISPCIAAEDFREGFRRLEAFWSVGRRRYRPEASAPGKPAAGARAARLNGGGVWSGV